jgi:tetratricopeptide (TPR) repeat protein
MEARTVRTRIGARMAAELWWWFAETNLSDGRRWLERAGSSSPADSTDPELMQWKALATAGAGWLAYVQSRHEISVDLAGRSLAMDPGQDPEVRLLAWSTVASVAADDGEFEKASATYGQALALAKEKGLAWWTAVCLHNLGFLGLLMGDAKAARPPLEESARHRRRIGDLRGLASTLVNLGSLDLTAGDAQAAYPLYVESLRLLNRWGRDPLTADLLEDLAAVLAMLDRPEQATRMLASIEAFRVDIDAPALKWRRAEHERTIANLRSRLGEQAYAAAWAEGSRLPVDRVAAEVLAGASRDSRPETTTV